MESTSWCTGREVPSRIAVCSCAVSAMCAASRNAQSASPIPVGWAICAYRELQRRAHAAGDRKARPAAPLKARCFLILALRRCSSARWRPAGPAVLAWFRRRRRATARAALMSCRRTAHCLALCRSGCCTLHAPPCRGSVGAGGAAGAAGARPPAAADCRRPAGAGPAVSADRGYAGDRHQHPWQDHSCT